MTPQEKIDEIHAILVRQESRARRRMIFSWWWKIILVIFAIIIALYPGLIIKTITNFLYPIVEHNVRQAIAEQKDGLINGVKNSLNSLKNSSPIP